MNLIPESHRSTLASPREGPEMPIYWTLLDPCKKQTAQIVPPRTVSVGSAKACDISISSREIDQVFGHMAFAGEFLFAWTAMQWQVCHGSVEVVWQGSPFFLYCTGSQSICEQDITMALMESESFPRELAAVQAQLCRESLHQPSTLLNRIAQHLRTGPLSHIEPCCAESRRRFVTSCLAIEWQIARWGILTPLMQDGTISEIMINGPDDIYIEKKGKIQRSSLRFRSGNDLLPILERHVRHQRRRLDDSSPTVDVRLPDGSRLNAILSPLARNGPCVTIRKFHPDRLTLTQMVASNTLAQATADLLVGWIRQRRNVVISGGTSTGKTTFLNALSAHIASDERIITIEDSAELDLRQPHVISLETRSRNAEGEGEFSIRELVRNALRMRPDRLIVGECRGAETLDMLQAMNTGHAGSLTTLHANSPDGALQRLETLAMFADTTLPLAALRRQIATAIHGIVQLTRTSEGLRQVAAVAMVENVDGTPRIKTILTSLDSSEISRCN